MREYYLSKKEMKPLIEQINKNWPEITINKLKNVKATDLKKGRFIITEEFKIIIINGTTIPFIKNNITENFPFIEVDINSIKFITNGANIMRPGITSFSHKFKKDHIILVKDQKYKKIYKKYQKIYTIYLLTFPLIFMIPTIQKWREVL